LPSSDTSAARPSLPTIVISPIRYCAIYKVTCTGILRPVYEYEFCHRLCMSTVVPSCRGFRFTTIFSPGLRSLMPKALKLVARCIRSSERGADVKTNACSHKSVSGCCCSRAPTSSSSSRLSQSRRTLPAEAKDTSWIGVNPLELETEEIAFVVVAMGLAGSCTASVTKSFLALVSWIPKHDAS